MVRALAALAVAAAVLIVVFSGRDDGAEAQACFGIEPFEFDTYEAYDNAGLYLAAIELAAAGEAVTFLTTPSGEPHNLEYPGLLTGSRDERLEQEPDTSLRIPPTLLKSVVWVESEFAHANSNVPWGGVGPVQRSFDCGFGLGQITSGMENHSGSPNAKQTLVGTHFVFNVAEAARMLAQKWNDVSVPIAGDGDPANLEDWYYAVWAYNGLFLTNHPLYDFDHQSQWLAWWDSSQYPFRDPLRGEVWHCDDTTSPTWISSGYGATPWFDYGDYTYPERVYGCMRYPPEYPSRLYDDPEYAPTPWPEPAPTETPAAEEGDDVGESGDGEGDETATGEEAAEEETPEPTPTPEATPAGDPWPAPGPDGIPRLWPSVQVNMPDFTIPAVAAAFSPQVYFPCSDSFWYDGCPALHFPTSFPDLGIEPHQDPTPPVDTSLRARLIGAPDLRVTAPGDVSIAVDEEGIPGSVEVKIENRGTWIGPYRIETSAPWILVRRSGGDARLHGGVAIGAETTVWICRAMYCGEDVTSEGHVAYLEITLDLEELPEGEAVSGYLLIEPLVGMGALKRIVVHAGSGVEGTTSQAEEHEEDDGLRLKHRIVIPNVGKDEE